ncbi:hypothetical protein TNCV_217891 [Trichonephila clavipes]|nr:hypothetical protein TNCV_217891 [Trichonephila clavipes]
MKTIVITAQIESRFVTENDLVPLPCIPIPLCATPLQTEACGRGSRVERGVPAQVSSTSLDHGSKLRGPSPKALVLLNSATLIFNQSINQTEASVGVIDSTRTGCRDTRCPSAGGLVMVQEDTRARSDGVACAWTAVNEAVGSTRECCLMRCSSRRLVCLERPEPGRLANIVSFLYWFQHLLTVKSERPTLTRYSPI